MKLIINYGKMEQRKSKHDLFVKIDADTVLNDEHSLAK